MAEALPESVQQQVRCGGIPSRAALRSLLLLARANEAQWCVLDSDRKFHRFEKYA